MSHGGLSQEQVNSLADLLDPQNGAAKMAFKRPESQSVGYSLSETPSAGATNVESNVGNMGATPANPGAVAIPAAIQAANSGLPTVSGTKAAKERDAKGGSGANKPKGNDIWDDTEVDRVYGSKLGAGEAKDTRETPEHEVLYRENRTAEDQYLAADFTRDGSAAMAEQISVKVQLPKQESVKDMELDVEPFTMHLRTPFYVLRAALPAKVVEKKGAAKWDGVNKVLTVTLTVDPATRQVKVI